MIGWLKLTDAQRKAVMDETEQLSGITAKAIEKDWWVTLTLKALFQSAYKDFMIFKGGTSLSKGWGLIDRFSEDIDIALDPQAFGMEYKEDPSAKFVSRLKKEGCKFTSTILKDELINQLQKLGIADNTLIVEAAPVDPQKPDTDPQTIFVKYKSLYDPHPYIADEVKIEIGVRSLKIPYTKASIQSLLSKINPRPAYAETPFVVDVVEPRKTFLEKIFLLHEEFGKADKTKIKAERRSRHLYDLAKNADSDFMKQALADHELYEHLIKHRRSYSRISWVDYDTLSHETVSIIPVDEVIEDYRQDYQAMREHMIYQDWGDFDQLIRSLKLLQGRLRLKHDERKFSEIIQIAEEQIQSSGLFKNATDGSFHQTMVVFTADPYQPPSKLNRSTIYAVGFKRLNGKLHFESIQIESDIDKSHTKTD